MQKQSAGILVFRRAPSLQFFLVHPGGPFWANRDEGAWSIPKGEFTHEDPLEAARREFREETGQTVAGDLIPLTPVVQKAGKIVLAFAVEGAVDEEAIVSNTFSMEWPPRSGRFETYPEVDRAGWFGLQEALTKINPAQSAFLHEVAVRFGS